MKQYKGTVAESWMPTFENVAREFITESLYKILFSEKLPNFKFDFRENEAIDFIERVLGDYTSKYDFYKEKAKRVLEEIKRGNYEEQSSPVMVVSDYKEFFEQLRRFYERDIELYFQRTGFSGFTRYEKDNCLEQIWLRATPEDFNNPEEFLRKQAVMINDRTFEKYDEETRVGELDFLDKNILCVKNDIARTWDESTREFKITIYDRKYYDKDLIDRPHYILPVIRYGIYEMDGKRVCFIGSIQNTSGNYEKNELDKKIDRNKYKANKGVPEEYTYKVEPKNLLALSIFINFLHRENIIQIEVPSKYVLDYEYHKKRNAQMLKEFEEKWTEEEKEEDPKQYKRARYYFERGYKKEDLISEIKSERLLLTFKRLLFHYTKGKIDSYPGDDDSFMHLTIPVVKSKDDINGSVFCELYELNEKAKDELEL